MQSVETRNVARDSLFLFAELHFEGRPEPVRVKVRNLSAGGMLAEAEVATERGARLVIKLRNIEDVKGAVAWVQGPRFGIAFDTQVDPRVVRAPVAASTGPTTPSYARSAVTRASYGEGPLRTI
ncbi:PilZ domain-containing protein [Qipengyuania sp. XHP0207]|uniref:PilZ domain-containing protein n=1 Tax=Qipengyuania sp. XHP0207 TaxID=3038078 RepID=UPI00241ECA91|nr:PilZ domain-containing protein [Qipengyuania sp. XHP0207]MDG5748269.1 PilZ domain-containing protein [Qipengyuania sp. XHP0207]